MKKSIIITLVVILLAAAIYALFLKTPGDQQSNAGEDPDSEYIVQYEWPEKPRVGHYTLRVVVSDKEGNQARDIEIIADYDMPSMRGHHRTEEKMKRNDKGDFLLPIYFAMRGDWEIILSVMKNGVKAAEKKITLYI
ncbi:MAG: FixH family protein [Spirochaetota bacterium]|jgi:hypothetical protein|nr:FixH family protein [Spirochaetota bacterium]